jgi:thymidylate kinase
MNKSRIIAFEGCDRIGKSTQVVNLTTRLNLLGYCALSIRFPYPGLTYSIIRKMLASGSATKFPNLFQFIQTINKIIFQITKLNKLKKENDFIIYDRCSLSTLAYGSATNSSEWLTNLLVKFIIKPDLVILLDGEQFNRINDLDTYDNDIKLQNTLRTEYLAHAITFSSPVQIINANAPINSITDDVILTLKQTNML